MSVLAEVKTVAVAETRWTLRTLAFVLPWLIALATIAPPVEGWLNPVLTHVWTGKAFIREDGWLCWPVHFRKARAGRLTELVAQVYRDDSDERIYRGIDHFNGDPWGGMRSGTVRGGPLGEYDDGMCINVGSHIEPGYYRLGVRVLWRFETPWRTYEIPQKPLWIDYRPNSHSMK